MNSVYVQIEARVSASGRARVDKDLGVALPEQQFVGVARHQNIHVHAALHDGQRLLVAPRNNLT